MQFKLLILASLFLLLIVGWFATSQDSPSIPSVQANTLETLTSPIPTPNHMITLTSGQTLSLYDIPQPVILLNIWASWCSICIEELPEMIELTKRMNGQVALVALSIDDTKTNLEKGLRKLPAFNKTYLYAGWDQDKSISLDLFNSIRVPETYIITKDRMIHQKIVGAIDWQGDQIYHLLTSLTDDY